VVQVHNARRVLLGTARGKISIHTTLSAGSWKKEWAELPRIETILPTASFACTVMAMHNVVALALPGVAAFDLAIPAQVFGHVDERERYSFKVCAAEPALVSTTTSYAIQVTHGLDVLHTGRALVSAVALGGGRWCVLVRGRARGSTHSCRPSESAVPLPCSASWSSSTTRRSTSSSRRRTPHYWLPL
jgi:hypothetical protein